MKHNFKSSDFEFTHFTKVAYVGYNVIFNRPMNLTKFDIAYVLSKLQPELSWFDIYDTFSKPFLVSRLLCALKTNELDDDVDDWLISDDLLDEANDHYNHFV